MSETTAMRSTRLMSTSKASLVMHCQDIAQQRDDLLEALHEIAAIGHDDTERPDHAVVRAMIVGMARDAVSKVEG